jgi:hypothetical protein
MIEVSCENKNEPLVCIRDGEFIEQLRDYQLLRKDFDP